MNAPYIQLDQVDSRYNIIEVAFAAPTSTSDMTMVFTPDQVTPSVLISQIQTLQSQGRKVLISIGGANSTIDLDSTINKNAFITSMESIISTYGFDGIDLDIENGTSITLSSGSSISSPTNQSQINLIDAVKQIMQNYWQTHNHKLLLTMAPETAFVQGGMSAFGNIWGSYLPIIDALRDSLDILQVQLYNSGTMYGIDNQIYSQGTADFIVAMTEATIQGFNTTGGAFAGLPPEKTVVGLPACTSAAGGGFTDTATVSTAIKYLRGEGTQPGTYTLVQTGGYPNLNGMMTWSINWDAVANCGGTYTYATNYEYLFGTITSAMNDSPNGVPIQIFPNPTQDCININLNRDDNVEHYIIIYDFTGREMIAQHFNGNKINISLTNFSGGLYNIQIDNINYKFIKLR